MPKSVSTLLLFAAVCGVLSSPTLGQDLSGRIQEVRGRLERDRYAGSAEHLGRLLYTDCEVRMEEAPIEDAVTWLAGATGAPLRILDDNKGQPGIDPSVEITLDVRGMPALTVLEIMMEQYEDDERGTKLLQQFEETKMATGSKIFDSYVKYKMALDKLRRLITLSSGYE